MRNREGEKGERRAEREKEVMSEEGMMVGGCEKRPKGKGSKEENWKWEAGKRKKWKEVKRR